jgi:hypothetical protein
MGGAVIYFCSLLHEATPVTRGLRYATLPFLYDAAAARVREELASPPGGNARACPRQRSRVPTLTPTSRETTSINALSGGSSRATMRSLNACPYRAILKYPRPLRSAAQNAR